MCSLHQDLSGGNISFDHMTLIVTFDLLSKTLILSLIFCKRQGYHIWHVWCIKQDLSVVVINLEHVTFDLHFFNMSTTDDSNKSKRNPSCSMPPVLIKATYNDYFSFLDFTDNLSSLSKEIQYKATCSLHLPLVTLLSYILRTVKKCPRWRQMHSLKCCLYLTAVRTHFLI